MPLVDQQASQQANPLEMLLKASQGVGADPSAMGGATPQGGELVPNWMQNVLSAMDQGMTTGFPGMTGDNTPENPRPEIMIPIMMAMMAGEPGPDVLGPFAKMLGKMIPSEMRGLMPQSVQEAMMQATEASADRAIAREGLTNADLNLHSTDQLLDEFNKIQDAPVRIGGRNTREQVRRSGNYLVLETAPEDFNAYTSGIKLQSNAQHPTEISISNYARDKGIPSLTEDEVLRLVEKFKRVHGLPDGEYRLNGFVGRETLPWKELREYGDKTISLPQPIGGFAEFRASQHLPKQ